jgi:hypothetical protein
MRSGADVGTAHQFQSPSDKFFLLLLLSHIRITSVTPNSFQTTSHLLTHSSVSAMSSSTPLFRAVGVGKKKDDGTWLFRNVDIELNHGVMTVTGPSGVG